MAIAKRKRSKPVKVQKTGDEILTKAAKHLITSRGLKFGDPTDENSDSASYFMEDESTLVTTEEKELFLALRTIAAVINGRTLPITQTDIHEIIENVLWKDDEDDVDEYSSAVWDTFMRACQTKIRFMTVPVAPTPDAALPKRGGLLKRLRYYLQSHPF